MDLGQYLTAFHVKHIQQVTKTRKRALVAYFDTITQMRPEKSNPESAFLSNVIWINVDLRVTKDSRSMLLLKMNPFKINLNYVPVHS